MADLFNMYHGSTTPARGVAGHATPDDDSAEAGTDPSIVDLTATDGSGREQAAVVLTSTYKRPRTDNGQWKEKALRVIRRINKDGNDAGTHLEISSLSIQEALIKILSNYTFLNLQARPIVIASPFAPLFHCQEALLEYAKAPERTPKEIEHLNVLTKDFYDNYLREPVKQYQAGIKNGMVMFSHLWMLFEAGDDILVQTPQYTEINRVMDCVEEVGAGGRGFTIYTWRWGYNAGKFGPCAETLRIPIYTQARAIDQLPYYPLKTLAKLNQDAIKKEKVSRGHRWRNLIGPSYKDYDGWMWTSRADSPRRDADLDVSWNKGRIMIDHQLYSESACSLDDQLVGAQGYKLNTREHGATDRSSNYSSTRVRATTGQVVSAGAARKIRFDQAECHEDSPSYEMTDDHALLSPARTKGFSMSEQEFAWFLVDNVSEVKFQEHAFDLLAMASGPKNMVKALTEFHATDKSRFEDIIKGKGQGMVISLEGPPGSGKTLTAESVAELTRKPFYPISTGALGTNARDAEHILHDIFKRGERWNAVVLLDEADLFLAKRTSQELDRNALVNVFLRNLEYYQGLIFLTSNRVEEFDHAFDSRIHLHVSFDQPDIAVRTQIWRHFIPKTWPDSAAAKLGRELEHINGREIKNLMRTATLLDESDDHELNLDLIRTIHENNLKCRAITAQSGPPAAASVPIP